VAKSLGEQGRAVHSWVEQGHAGPGQAGHGRAGQGRAGRGALLCWAGLGFAGLVRVVWGRAGSAGQCIVAWSRAVLGRQAGHGGAGQGRAGLRALLCWAGLGFAGLVRVV
jgi:hypothetical protein